jgi:hypothetical protein
MSIARIALVVAALAAAAGQATAARAQGARPLNPSGLQDLGFGLVFPGIPVTVLRTDAAGAGRFDIRGTRNAEVRLDFTLPVAMTAPGGASMPLVFGAGDGGFGTQNDIAAAQAFDPRVPLIARLGGNGRLFIWLGGTVWPSPTQPAAAYSAVVTVTATYTGN